MNDEVIKYLLGRVIELEKEVKDLKAKSQSLVIPPGQSPYMGQVTVPYIGQPLITTCAHEFDTNTMLPRCKKCGYWQTVITCTN